MKDILSKARDLKNQAMDARDVGRFEKAREKLRDAEAMLVKALTEQRQAREGEQIGDLEREIAKQLVHIRGSIGGVWRREGNHIESARAYDSGYEVERAESGYGIVDSYTLVQRLVARIFVDPAAADDDLVLVEHLAVRPELKKAEDLIRDQIKKIRERDEYAHADLMLVLVLLGSPDWRTQLRRFRELKPAYALAATRDVGGELQEHAATSSRASQRLRDDLANALSALQ